MIDITAIEATNDDARTSLQEDYAALGALLDRRSIDIDAIRDKVAAYGVAVPSLGVGTGVHALPASPAQASRAASSTGSTISA